jgi:hypothetical protein
MWVHILPPIERMAPSTRSMKGSGATIVVLYSRYWETPVMPQPHNPAQDTPKLPGAALGGFHYWNRRYPYGQLSTKYPNLGASHPPEKRHPLQWQDKTAHGETDSKSLSGQVKLAPHGTDSKNLLERHPPQHQEHSRSPQPTFTNRPSLVWAPLVLCISSWM